VIYVVGGRGFVGSAYVRLFESLGLPFKSITRENFEVLRDTSCDVLIDANGNSDKILAANAPFTDFDLSVNSVAKTVAAFSTGKYVFLSSGDVYPDQSQPDVTREKQLIDSARQSRYGLHKYLAEQILQCTQPRWLIVRMGGFVGMGLKKNAIFDMMTGAPMWLTADSELQFLSTDTAAKIVWNLVTSGVTHESVNLGGRGTVNLGDLHRRIGSASTFRPEARKIRYELSLEKLSGLASDVLPESKAEVETFLGTVGFKILPN
jgi:nucleoside-diphosphate-sugar epimerase